MIHPRRDSDDDPARRSRLLSRYLDPEYIGSPPNVALSLRNRSPSLPQASVFVDRYGEQHDPDFRPFGSYPVVTPAAEEHQTWPWDDDDDDRPTPISGSTSPRSRLSHFNSQSTNSSYYSSQSSGTRSRTSVLTSPSIESEPPHSPVGRLGSPPAHIPRSALYPWTPAQRAARIPNEGKRRSIPLPSSFIEEEPEIPLALVDSSYVPGYGHFVAPPQRSQTTPEASKPKSSSKCGRARAHTVPSTSPSTAQLPDEEPPSPSSTYSHSLRQSVYLLGLKTKLGLYHMKARMRRASSAAKRPLSL